jgi:hypothetical protein
LQPKQISFNIEIHPKTECKRGDCHANLHFPSAIDVHGRIRQGGRSAPTEMTLVHNEHEPVVKSLGAESSAAESADLADVVDRIDQEFEILRQPVDTVLTASKFLAQEPAASASDSTTSFISIMSRAGTGAVRYGIRLL